MGVNINILKSTAGNDYQYPTYSDAINESSIFQVGDIIIVEQTTGGIFGIGSKQAGSYRWTGTSLEYFSQSLKNEIKENEDNLTQEISDRVSSDLNLQNQIDFNLVDNRVIVKQASDLLNIDSTKVYLIDGKIDMGTIQIEVPSTGIFIKGLDYFVSSLFSSQPNYSLFVNAPNQNAGNLRASNVEFYTTGSGSRVFDLDNQGNFGAVEFQSVNFGTFFSQQDSLGNLSNYRQFRTNDCAFIRVLEGIVFNGTWAGGFRIGDSILLSIPVNAVMFKEGSNLSFQGSSFTDINAISVDNSATVFDFQETNFLLDEGFKIGDARFNINSNPIPNLPETSVKASFRGRGVRNTFPGARWEVTTQQITPLTAGATPVKMNGITTYEDLTHFTSNGNNSIRYLSEIGKSFVISGQLVVDGGPNDEIEISIVKINTVNATQQTVRTFVRRVSNLLGGLDIAIFDPYAYTDIVKNDDIEVFARNLTDGTDATLLEGSFLAINVRN